MTRFDDLAAFAAVVREGSFTRAAAQMGVTQSALSQTIRTLERKLDLKLLNRTTRSVSTTEAGERLYQAVGPRFADIDAELAALSESRDTPAGTVRITATETAARMLVWPRLQPLLSRYPDIKIEISSENRFIDIVAERFDIGVRLGGDVAKDMIAVRMAPDMRMTVVGSPGYFERRSPPRTLQDLAEHDCICLRLPTHGALLHWEFKRRGKNTNVQVTGRLVFNATDLVVAATMAGHGLAWVPAPAINEHVAAGSLTPVLDDWAITYPGHHLYYASRSASPALALVVEALRVPKNK
ncbi:LysR family transcriptional regulator [Rhizobacter sp. Root1221]|uniref:LysR family transcriptional regulator n=1 Tax=Rhizobacter sp. Root1221 TaxID=1736433 RepID=UPI0006F72ACE|nr:LysR family transcriptional regulator [Rhizobacter sp. Root1221]KQV94044.1 LysR family transcriptional regulator [Rhizobacter sp. Root1221]